MLKVGLTGGIGSGKSAATKRFAYHAVPIVDADAIARQIVMPGEVALDHITAHFGTQILQADGHLNRRYLRQLVFSDPAALQQLEAILHPAIRQRIQAEVAQHTDQAYVILDIPLLFEKGYKDECDRIVVVDCDPEQQIERVMCRDQVSRESVEQIMAKQVSRMVRLQYATDVLDNTGTLTHLQHLVDLLHTKFLEMGTIH